jgi:hypothetical protein
MSFLSDYHCLQTKYDNLKEFKQISCEIDCEFGRFEIKRTKETFAPQNSHKRIKNSFQNSITLRREEEEEHFFHLPAISFIDYLCSIGGVIGIYFGHHI